MSDKKQPAQQRVNVRIVKADDPEQRGGMKPIAKADGSLQISPEEAYTAGIWTKPPFDLRGLSKMVDESTILPQCIRAYKSNIAGFGIDIRYKDDFADADETPEMKAEWDRATEVVEMLNMEQESNELFEDIVEARETYGCAYAEVIRDMDGNVIQLEVKVLSSERIRAINEAYHTHTVALDKKGNPYINGGNVVFRDERDNAKATRHILVEALQYPKLDDPELMKYYNCVDITQMPEKVFSRADEFAHVTRVVMALLGIGGQLSEEEQKQADEKEIDDAKN